MLIKPPSEVIKPIGLRGESEGFYTFEIIKTDRKGRGIEATARKVAEFPNLITDAGLLRMGDNTDYLSNLYVGSGNTPPTFLDTQLANRITGSMGSYTREAGVSTSAPYYAYERRTWTSAVGAVSGNISEVGVGPSFDNLFSRALVEDALGNPTSITVLSDEQLRVTYEHRYYAPSEDITGSFTLTGNLGATYSFIARAAMVTSAQQVNGWTANMNQTFVGNPANGWGSAAYTGPIGSVTGLPSGSLYTLGQPSPGVGEGLTRNFSTYFSLTQGNLTGGIRSVTRKMGNGRFQFQIDPPIPKTNEDTLSLVFSMSWGRK